MKYLLILVAASAISTAGGYFDENKKEETPVEIIEFIDPIYITPESVFE